MVDCTVTLAQLQFRVATTSVPTGAEILPSNASRTRVALGRFRVLGLGTFTGWRLPPRRSLDRREEGRLALLGRGAVDEQPQVRVGAVREL